MFWVDHTMWECWPIPSRTISIKMCPSFHLSLRLTFSEEDQRRNWRSQPNDALLRDRTKFDFIVSIILFCISSCIVVICLPLSSIHCNLWSWLYVSDCSKRAKEFICIMMSKIRMLTRTSQLKDEKWMRHNLLPCIVSYFVGLLCPENKLYLKG